ncbi:hypothetical protein GOODEAATRI_023077 [Goodea atripinnis]|uniref:Uncharacterized protein n=1 Tax=Goodea atripinnis TaxID=208336 RepID=A0ABV0PGA0_9TELE
MKRTATPADKLVFKDLRLSNELFSLCKAHNSIILIFSYSYSSSSTLSRTGLRGQQTLQRHPGGIWYRRPSHPNWLLSMWKSSGSTPSPSRMAELLTLSLRECPATLRRKLILAACIRDLVLSA